jgi:hypothetical protein
VVLSCSIRICFSTRSSRVRNVPDTNTIEMPSVISQKLSDLEAERTSFLLYERRIIQERADILTKVRIHLNQLDVDIVRLGGTARVHGGQSPSFSSSLGSSHFSSGDVNVLVPSAAPFSSMLKSDESPQPRGRPTKSLEGAAGPGMAISVSKKDDGYNQREEDTSPEKENVSSNDASPSDSSSEALNEERARTFMNSTASAKISERFTLTDAVKVQMIEKTNKKKKKSKSVASSDNNSGEPWTCDCGEHMAAGRARCGKCRRWKGGKRLVRWSVKPKDPTTINTSAVASLSSLSQGNRKAGNGKKNTDVPKAIDVYRNLRTAELDSVTNVSPAKGNCGQDLEIQVLVEQMVKAVVNAADLGGAKKMKGSRKSSVEMAAASKKENTSPAPNNEGETVSSHKRKRGRPKKDSKKNEIQRVVTTSDSDNGSEAPRKRGRPRKNPATNKDVEQGAEQKVHSEISQHPLLNVNEKILVVAEESATPAAAINVSTGQTPSLPRACLSCGETEQIRKATPRCQMTVGLSTCLLPCCSRQRDLISKGLTGASLTDFQIDYVADHFRFYFDRIKHAFAGTPQMHCKLLDVVAMFRAKELDTAGFISRLLALLDGRGDLILGVAEFLPDTYHSAVSRDDS